LSASCALAVCARLAWMASATAIETALRADKARLFITPPISKNRLVLDELRNDPLLSTRRCAAGVQGSDIGPAVGECVDEEDPLPGAALVAHAELRELGLAAAVVVVQVDEERHDALAALAQVPLVVRHVGVDEIEVFGVVLADVVVEHRHRLEM